MIDQGADVAEPNNADMLLGMSINDIIGVGTVKNWVGVSSTPPAGWLFPYGQAVLRTDWPLLFASLSISSLVTITIASPAVITWVGHPLDNRDPVVLHTDSALPTGIVAGTVYYAKYIDANTIQISATPGGASINTSGSQSGNQTGWYIPFGDGDGSTTFNLPDYRGRVIGYRDDMGGVAAGRLTGIAGSVDGGVLGATGGEESHSLSANENGPHQHPMGLPGVVLNSGGGQPVMTGGGTILTGVSGLGTPHNNVQPIIILNAIIFGGL